MAKKNGIPKMCGEGAGGNRRYPYNFRYQNDQNSTLINLFTVILMSGQP